MRQFGYCNNTVDLMELVVVPHLKLPVSVARPGELGIAFPVATHSQMSGGAVLKVVILAESSVTFLLFCTWVSAYETVQEPV
jgi:hypothetical protein